MTKNQGKMHPSFYKIIGLLILNLLILKAPCSAEEVPKNLTFAELILLDDECTGQGGCLIQINGFLYNTPDGKTILSPEPNLKSCCVGSRAKRSQQILLSDGAIKPIHQDRAVAIRGILKKAADGDFLFHLNDARLVDGVQGNALGFVAGLSFVLASGTAGYLFIKRRNHGTKKDHQ